MNIRINDIVNNTLNNTVAGGMNNGLYNGTGIRRNTRRMPKPMILLIGMLFMAVGVFLIIKTVHNNRVLTAETTAVITEIREEVTTSHDTNSNKAVIEVNSKPKTRTYYYPSIKYMIDGQTYYNDLSRKARCWPTSSRLRTTETASTPCCSGFGRVPSPKTK